jgi:transposase
LTPSRRSWRFPLVGGLSGGVRTIDLNGFARIKVKKRTERYSNSGGPCVESLITVIRCYTRICSGVSHYSVGDITLPYRRVVQGNQLRSGAEYFTRPAGAGQRRYEAMRAYFVEEASAAEVADRFGYSTASVHQMATLLRTGKLPAFTEVKPGPKGPRKITSAVREKVLALRADTHSVSEIAAALAKSGIPICAQTVWSILDAAGLPRLDRRDEARRGSPAKLDPVKAAAQPSWPAGTTIDCGHAGLLLLLFPAMAELGLHNRSPRLATRPLPRSPPGNRWAPCCWPSAHAATEPTTSTRSPTTPGSRTHSA